MATSNIADSVPPPGDVTQMVEHFFRHESGKIISTLTRIFGLEQLNRAEAVMQETLVKALQTGPYYGIPKNPSVWMTQVAKNLALDLIRRDRSLSHQRKPDRAFDGADLGRFRCRGFGGWGERRHG